MFLAKYYLLVNDKILNTFYNKNYLYASVFFNLELLDIFMLDKSIKQYNIQQLWLKKQVTFLKKKNNLLNNFYEITQKNKASIENGETSSYYSLSTNNNLYRLYEHSTNTLDFSKVIDLRKKVKKTILENRKNLVNFLLNGSKRSKKISSLVSLLGKKKIWFMCNILELNIIHVLLNSCLVKSYMDAINFIKNGYVYINRRMVSNTKYVVKKGDVIEIFYSKLYFRYLLQFRFINEKTYLKIRNKLWAKIKNKTSLTSGNERYLIKYYKDNSLFKYHIPSYIEVDFSVLSLIIVANIKSFYDLSYYFRKNLSYYFIRQYNWKWLS